MEGAARSCLDGRKVALPIQEIIDEEFEPIEAEDWT
jgi:hypothetical protein